MAMYNILWTTLDGALTASTPPVGSMHGGGKEVGNAQYHIGTHQLLLCFAPLSTPDFAVFADVLSDGRPTHCWIARQDLPWPDQRTDVLQHVILSAV